MERTIETQSCLFLERLPPELRLHIYGFVWEHPIVCILPVLSRTDLRRRDIHVLPDDERRRLALLESCKTIRAEVSPLLYDKVYFHLRVTIESLCLPLGVNSSLEQCHFLHRIQRLCIKTQCSDLAEFRLRFSQLQKIREVLEKAEVVLKQFWIFFSVTVEQRSYNPRDAGWFDFVDEANWLVVEWLDGQRSADTSKGLFRLTLEALRDEPLRPPGDESCSRVVI